MSTVTPAKGEPSEPSCFQWFMHRTGFTSWLASTFTDAPHANKTSQTILRTPKDYGMEFEDVRLPALDGCQIAAWYIPAKDPASKKLAILSHQSWSYANKSGMKQIPMPMMPGLPGMFTQNAIDYVKLHKVLHDDGFHVLAWDQRNHGESEVRLPSGWGMVEFMDVAGVMDHVNAHPVLKDCQVVALPMCVAGQAFLKANTLFPEKFKNVKAVVTTNLFTVRKMWLEARPMHACFMRGGSLAYVHEKTLDLALRAKQDAYVKKGNLKKDANIDFCTEQLCATTYAPNCKAPVLYCTPKHDWKVSQSLDAPEIFGSFAGDNNEFHFIGTDQPTPFKTDTNNRSEGYNFYQSEAGSAVMLEFLHKHGL